MMSMQRAVFVNLILACLCAGFPSLRYTGPPSLLILKERSDAGDLQRYKARNQLLEEAIKTLRAQLLQGGDEQDPKALEVAERRISELQGQISNEVNRAERMRASWQNELVKLSERLGLAEQETERWKVAAKEAQIDAGKLMSRVKSLETALAESEQEIGVLRNSASRASGGSTELQEELQEAKSRIEKMTMQYRVAGEQQQALLDAARREANAELQRVIANSSTFASSSDELREQRALLQQQTELLEALVIELAALGVTSLRGPPSLPSGDLSRAFSVRNAQQANGVRSAQPLSSAYNGRNGRGGIDDEGKEAEAEGRLVKTQQIIVDGEPYLIDEDNNLYSTGDHTFVRKLSSYSKQQPTTQSRVRESGGTAGKERRETSRTARRSERLRTVRRRLGDGISGLVGGAQRGLAAASRSVFNFLVGEDDEDEEDEKEEKGRGRVYVDVQAVELDAPPTAARIFDSTKMRPQYLDRGE